MPQEDRNEEVNESKMAKYAELLNEWQMGGRLDTSPDEIRFKGSPCRAYYMLGITETSRQSAIKEAIEAVKVYSRCL